MFERPYDGLMPVCNYATAIAPQVFDIGRVVRLIVQYRLALLVSNIPS